MRSATDKKSWVFTEVAPGLLTGADATTSSAAAPNTVSKPASNNALYDAAGEPLSEEESKSVSTWRSHHAFSARCETVRDASSLPITSCVDRAEDESGWRRTMAAWRNTYRSWEAHFRLSALSSDGQPNMLLSVAPFYFPYVVPDADGTQSSDSKLDLTSLMASSEDQHRYNARVLQTPLIWEEPMVLSVECGARGLFLWSEQWAQYGVKLADRCLTRRVDDAVPAAVRAQGSSDVSQAGLVPYEASVRLRWEMVPPTSTDVASSGVLSVALGAASANASASEPSWQTVAEHKVPLTPLGSHAVFLPHVTLMEKHDSVTVF